MWRVGSGREGRSVAGELEVAEDAADGMEAGDEGQDPARPPDPVAAEGLQTEPVVFMNPGIGMEAEALERGVSPGAPGRVR